MLELCTINDKYLVETVYLKATLDDDMCLHLLEGSLLSFLYVYDENTRVIIQGDFNTKIGQLNQINKSIFNHNKILEESVSLLDVIDQRGRKIVEILKQLGLYVSTVVR